MAAFLTSPFALAGLLVAPLLAAIYLLHRRPRPVEVSSLMLWAALRRPAGGGRTVEPPRFPPSFWLELAIIVLLVLAAAGPLLPWSARERPLIVILDDSLSMQAGRGSDTARNRAYDFLTRSILGGTFRPIRFVLAGATPQLAGPAVTSEAAARAQLERWSCSATAADVDAALAFAAQIAERDALMLVITDRAPERKPGPRIRWEAFGRNEANAAFISAGRWSNGGRDRVIVELAGYSRRPVSTPLVITAGTRVLHSESVALGANARRSIAFDLPPATGDVEARIDDDGAAFDNRVVLLRESRAPLPVSLDIADDRLRQSVERALTATERAVVVPRGDVLITDRALSAVGASASGARPAAAAPTLQFDARPGGVSYAGPFFIDRSHPLTDGLALDGVIWTAPRGSLPGTPLVMAGRQALVADETLPDGEHRVHVALDPALSNLDRSPAWPALLWNLVEWRSRLRPGLRPANVAVGSNVELALPAGAAQAFVSAPDGTTRTLAAPPASRSIPIMATRPGVWKVKAGGDEYRFAANALVAQESDLSGASSGEKSAWGEQQLTLSGYRNIAPLLLLAALAVAAAHQRLVAGAATA